MPTLAKQVHFECRVYIKLATIYVLDRDAYQAESAMTFKSPARETRHYTRLHCLKGSQFAHDYVPDTTHISISTAPKYVLLVLV